MMRIALGLSFSVLIYLPMIFWGPDGTATTPPSATSLPPPPPPRQVVVDSFAEIAWDALGTENELLTPELVILPGAYHETLTVQASGQPGAPLRITVVGPVVIDGDGVRQSGIDISGQNYIIVDGRGLLQLRGHTGERVGSVEVRHAHHVAITGVVIDNAASRGIFFDDVDDSRIANCDIRTGDVANGVQTDGIYMQFGRGNMIENNIVVLGNNGDDHNDALQAANGESDLTVRGNWLAHTQGRGNSASQALIIEQPAAPVYVYNNVIVGARDAWQVALFKDVARGGVYTIWNNTIVAQHSRSVPLRLYNTVDAGLGAVQNNILVSRGAPAMMNDNGVTYGPGKIDHNLIHGTSTASRIGGRARDWAAHQAAGYDVHGVYAAPGFAADGYRLAANSPAIDRGVPLAGVSEDRDGEARPQHGGWDIGADEYAGESDDSAVLTTPQATQLPPHPVGEGPGAATLEPQAGPIMRVTPLPSREVVQ